MNWKEIFPIKEDYASAFGQRVEFEITAEEIPTGFIVQAVETLRSHESRFGFRMRVFSAVSPIMALGEMREKIRKRISTAYLEPNCSPPQMSHNRMVGVVDHSEEDNEVVLQVDGRKVGRRRYVG